MPQAVWRVAHVGLAITNPTAAAAPLGAAAEQANPVRFACYQRENWAPNFLFG